MSKESPTQDRLADIAGHTLAFFEEAAANALEQLGEGRKGGADAFAVLNTLTTEKAVRNLEAINSARVEALRSISKDPAIARVVAIDDSGKEKTYFISRATPQGSPVDGSSVASYRSPIGRLASLPIGSDFEFKTPSGVRSLEIVERSVLHAQRINDNWDVRRQHS